MVDLDIDMPATTIRGGVELRDSEETTAEQSLPEADKQPYLIMRPLELQYSEDFAVDGS